MIPAINRFDLSPGRSTERTIKLYVVYEADMQVGY